MVFGVLIGVMSVAAGLIWLERRLLALWQERYGPNRVGPFGLLQVVADMIQILAKEDWVPAFADEAVFILSPCLVVAATLMSFSVIPFSRTLVVPEAENELVAGYHTEYSGMKFAMFFLGEYIGLTLVPAMIVTLFLGGWRGPVLPPEAWFFLKTMLCIVFFILVRGSLPRPRYDQLMRFGWKILLPLTLLNLVVTGGLLLARGHGR